MDHEIIGLSSLRSRLCYILCVILLIIIVVVTCLIKLCNNIRWKKLRDGGGGLGGEWGQVVERSWIGRGNCNNKTCLCGWMCGHWVIEKIGIYLLEISIYH